MKRKVVVPLLCVLLAFTLTVPALASDGSTRHWWDAFSWFGDVANFIKYLIVPADNYFHNELAVISALANSRLGGVGKLYQILNRFFIDLSSVPSVGLSVKLPNDLFFRGYNGISFDFLTSARPYLNFIRPVLTTSFCLMIAVACYHRLRTFFTESE